jgi:DNA-binding winged helix-turn-helix (wHTH) protein
MESRSAPSALERGAEVVVAGPDGRELGTFGLTGDRVTVGRLPEHNDIVLQPDPELLVTRVAHLTFEREGTQWYVVDGGGVNGTFLRRAGAFDRIGGRTALRNGDVVSVLASITEAGERAHFELAFRTAGDSQATRAVPVQAGQAPSPGCLEYDAREARLVLVQGDAKHEIEVRAQAHLLVRYMAERNAAAGGAPALCTHEELMHAVWADEPMHTHTELAKLVWELRRKLEPFGATHLIENERRRGYRIRTCPDDA